MKPPENLLLARSACHKGRRTLSQLSQRLDERFRLLTGGDRTALPRQQTLRAAIDWSYDLLSDAERMIFRRVSIFQGGWTLEAASNICSGDGMDEFEILDILSSLVNKSLVTVELNKETQRYRLLESLRQYGIERLHKDGEFDAIALRHAKYFADTHGVSRKNGRLSHSSSGSLSSTPKLITCEQHWSGALIRATTRT